jgi:threonine efflux protein
MHAWTSLISLVLVWSIVVVSPGPCFLAAVQHAAAGTRRDGMFVALGIALGTLLWCTLSLLGLSLLFAKVTVLYDTLRVAGGIYLIYLGVRAIRGARAPLVQSPLARVSHSPWRALRTGFLTDISNPKAAAFFGSLFAALLPAGAPLRVQASAVSVVIGIELAWYCLVSVLFSQRALVRLYERAKRWIDYATGLIFIGLGARLAATR